ncbi:MAG TPA: hypothetical protein VFZ51_04415 [Woeseiaceae bacterium]
MTWWRGAPSPGLSNLRGSPQTAGCPEFVQIAPDGGDLAGRVALIVLIQSDPSIREGDRVGLSLQLERAFYFGETGANLL